MRRGQDTVTGIHAFPITPDLFRAYARWRSTRNVHIIQRGVVKGPNNKQSLLVFFRHISFGVSPGG